MSADWAWRPLSDLVDDLTDSRVFSVGAEDEITNPTISSADHTISPAGTVISGRDVLVARRVRIRPGDLVFSRLHTQNGAFAYSDDEFEATTTFIPCRVRENCVDRRFLFWALHKYVPTLSASDSVGRETFKTRDILALKVPVPAATSEQHRIARHVDECAAGIKMARDLHRCATDELLSFHAAVLHRAFTGQLTEKWRGRNGGIEPAKELLDQIRKIAWVGHTASRIRRPLALPPPPELPKTWLVAEAGLLQESGAILDIQDGNHGGDYPRKSEFAAQGVPFVTAKQIANGTVDVAGAPRLPSWRAQLLRIGFAHSGDVLLTHNASVGDVAIAPPEPQEFLIGTSVTYWRCNSKALDPRYLYYFMLSELFQSQLRFVMKQTTRNQVSVLKQVNLWLCFAPLAEQQQIVAALDAVFLDFRSVLNRRAQTESELGAMLPAILGRTFDYEYRVL